MTYKKLLFGGFYLIFILTDIMQYHFLLYQPFITFFSPPNTNSMEEGYFW